jgi:hypothetical protein
MPRVRAAVFDAHGTVPDVQAAVSADAGGARGAWRSGIRVNRAEASSDHRPDQAATSLAALPVALG